jgi:hypothetical protein
VSFLAQKYAEMAFADQVLLLLYLQIAWGNILEFRKKNWRFDVIGGVVYFVLVFSMFPQVEHLTLCAYRIQRVNAHIRLKFLV